MSKKASSPLADFFIDIGIKISFLKFLVTRMLLVANSGGGKSWAIRKLVEVICGHVQTIVLDPEGEFITLREKFDFALVSKEGEIPISVRYGEAIAHKLLETGVSAIIDMYELPHMERVLFVKKFCNALINAPKELWHNVVIVLDEAHVFCPQGAKSESAEAVIGLATRGRKRGFNLVLATQRVSRLSKDASAECRNKLIGLTNQDLDRARSAEELEFTTKEQAMSLRKLPQGEFFAFGPAMGIPNEVQRFKVGPVKTTHQEAGTHIVAAPKTPAAIAKILDKISSIPQEAEKDLQTKKQYQDEINRLKKENALLKSTTTKAQHAGAKMLTPMPDPKQQAKLQQAVEENQQLRASLKSKELFIQNFFKQTGLLGKSMERATELIKSSVVPATTDLFRMRDEYLKGEKMQPAVTVSKAAAPISTSKQNAKADRPVSPPHSQNNGVPENTAIKMGKGNRALLIALAMYQPEAIKRNKAAFIAEISPSGGYFRNIIGQTKAMGYLEVQGEYLQITREGLDFVGEYNPLPTDPAELVEYWSAKLGKGTGSLLRVLFDNYPNYITRAELGQQAGIDDAGGYFRNCLGELRTLTLLDEKERPKVKLSEDLFN